MKRIQTDDGLKDPTTLGDAAGCTEVSNPPFLDDPSVQRASTDATFF